MPLPDDGLGGSESAKWVAVITGAAVLIWRGIWSARRDAREDKDGGSRQALISNLKDEIKRLNENRSELLKMLETETELRRKAESESFYHSMECDRLMAKLLELKERKIP